jgi:predicted phosphohydrolase
MFESDEDHDEKILNRELIRLKMSLDSAKCDEKIVFLHYPPVTNNLNCEPILQLLKDYGIKKCYYGHLHGVASKLAYDGKIDEINFKLISCDKLSFTPLLIL